MRKNLNAILLLVILVVTAILSVANMQTVTVNYVLGAFDLPLILLILVSVALGMLIQFLLSFFKNMSLHQEIKKLKADQAKLAEKEVTAK